MAVICSLIHHPEPIRYYLFMKRSLLAVFVLLISIQALVAQTKSKLAGRVVDKQNSAVGFATVSVLNSAYVTATDANGAFDFGPLPAGKYTLLVSSVGYATTSFAVALDANSQPVVLSLERTQNNYETVVVTAQKREEILQNTPVSISALGATQVRAYRLWNNNELAGIVPNFYSANSGDDRNVSSVRGITTTSYDPAVATYIDGVNQFSLDTYIPNLIDVERIEVLRGPQGTLYGRNAMGGVINIITRQPTNSTNGFVEANVGNYGLQRYTAGIRTPIVKNKLFLSVAGVYQKRDGYYTNELTNSSYDDQQYVTGNYSLKYMVSRNWSITANLKHHNNRNKGAYPLVFGVAEAFNNPFKLSQNATAKMIDNTVNASLSVNHTGDHFNFSSQTSYQSNQRYYNAPLDGDFSPIDGVTIINDYGKEWNRVKAITQEFKFTSPAYQSSAFTWTAGAYLFHQDNPTKLTTHFGQDAALLGAPDNNFSLTNTNKGTSNGFALFGQTGYALTEKLELIAGIRYDYEKKEYSVLGEYQKDPDPAVVTQPDTSASVNYSAVSPRIGLTYQVNERHFIYATYNRGFRAGGLTQLSTDPSQPPLFAYKPEYGNNWELGIKNSFAKGIHVNAVVFYSRVNDAQVPTLILPEAITITRNAGKLRSFGAELEVDVPVSSYAQVDYRAGFTDAEYTTLKVSQNGNEVNLAGKKQIFTPAFTSMLALQLYSPQTWIRGIRFGARAEYHAFGKQYFDLGNSIEQGSYGLINWRVGATIHKKYEVYFWGRNAGDKKYISYAYDFGAIHLGNPRTWGVTLSARL